MNVSDFKIWLDPGHGGADPGASSVDEPIIHERDAVLVVAKRAEELLKSWGATVQMTRTDNTTAKVDTKLIPDKVNEWGADIFVSIHCNALDGDATSTGTETYTAREYSSYDNDLAERVQNKVSYFLGTRNRGVNRVTYNVLNGNNAWAVLTELLFIDNPKEAALLRDSNKLEDAGEAIAYAIRDFVNANFRNIPA